MTITQKILSIALIWVVLSILNLGSFRAVDKQYKLKYLLNNTYKLHRIKILFSFYEREKGEIAKYVLWLNVVFYLINIIFISIFIAFIVLQTPELYCFSLAFALAQIALAMVTGGFNIYYDVKTGKTK